MVFMFLLPSIASQLWKVEYAGPEGNIYMGTSVSDLGMSDLDLRSILPATSTAISMAVERSISFRAAKGLADERASDKGLNAHGGLDRWRFLVSFDISNESFS